MQIILDYFLVFTETGVEDSSFAYGLLMELTRAYLAYADNSRAQDSAAYAIQVRVHVVITDFMLLAFSKKFLILYFGNSYFLTIIFFLLKKVHNKKFRVQKYTHSTGYYKYFEKFFLYVNMYIFSTKEGDHITYYILLLYFPLCLTVCLG